METTQWQGAGSDQWEKEPARLAAFALRADADAVEPLAELVWTLQAQSDPIRTEELIGLLADEEKPLRCAASLTGSLVHVRCDPEVTTGQQLMHSSFAARLAADVAAVMSTDEPDDLRVGIWNRGERLVTSFATFQLFLEEYNIKNLEWKVMQPTDSESSEGLRARIEIFGGD